MIASAIALLALIGADTGPTYTLVHDAPVGTSLATPDLPRAAPTWCAMLEAAKRSVDFEQFYVAGKSGSALDRVIGCMERAAKRGVKIRFLMEGKGVAMSDAPTLARLRAIPGLEFRMLAFASLGGNGIIHAKFFVVDDRAAYLGSQNFDWRSLEHIDETGVRIDDPHIAGQLEAIFAQDWQAQASIAAGARVVPVGQAEVAVDPNAKAILVASPLAYDPPGVADSQAELVRLLGEATHEVRVTVMDYAPLDQQKLFYGVIDGAIRAAAARGVTIKLVVADWDLTRAKTPWLRSLAAIPNVEIRVATIPPAPEGPIPFARVVHTKAMEIDDRIAWIGTSNWEGGYLDTSRNVELVLRDPAMAERVRRLHETLWSSVYAKPLDIATAARQAEAKP